MSANLSLLGSRIRKFRRRAHFTQENLAERANLTVQHIGNIETGKKRASINALIRIADALDITVDLLLLGSYDSEIATHVCEFAELIIGCDIDRRDAILEAAIAAAEKLETDE